MFSAGDQHKFSKNVSFNDRTTQNPHLNHSNCCFYYNCSLLFPSSFIYITILLQLRYWIFQDLPITAFLPHSDDLKMLYNRYVNIVERLLVGVLECFKGQLTVEHVPHQHSWVSGKKSVIVRHTLNIDYETVKILISIL